MSYYGRPTMTGRNYAPQYSYRPRPPSAPRPLMQMRTRSVQPRPPPPPTVQYVMMQPPRQPTRRTPTAPRQPKAKPKPQPKAPKPTVAFPDDHPFHGLTAQQVRDMKTQIIQRLDLGMGSVENGTLSLPVLPST